MSVDEAVLRYCEARQNRGGDFSEVPLDRDDHRVSGHGLVPALRAVADAACRSGRRPFVIRVNIQRQRGAPRWCGTCCPRTPSRARRARR